MPGWWGVKTGTANDIEVEQGDLSEIHGISLVDSTISEAQMRHWQLSEASFRMARSLRRKAKGQDDAENKQLLEYAKILDDNGIKVIVEFVQRYLVKAQVKEITEQKKNFATNVKEQDDLQRQKWNEKKEEIRKKNLDTTNTLSVSVVPSAGDS